MPGQDQRLDGQEQGLQPEDGRMYEPDGVDDMQVQPAGSAYPWSMQLFVIARVRICNAATAGRDAGKLALI